MLKATVTGRIWSTKKFRKCLRARSSKSSWTTSNSSAPRLRSAGLRVGREGHHRDRIGRGKLVSRKIPPIDALIIGSIDDTATK
jgi:hypothetical protein